MEADEIHAALQVPEQPDEFLRMFRGVVPAVENGVFKAHAALAAKVVLLEQADDFCFGPSLLYGHHLRPLLREGIVQADGQVALAFIQELLEPGHYADGTQSNAFGAPGQAPGGGEHLYHPFHMIPVVQRLSHSHKHGIGEFSRLLYGEVLA